MTIFQLYEWHLEQYLELRRLQDQEENCQFHKEAMQTLLSTIGSISPEWFQGGIQNGD